MKLLIYMKLADRHVLYHLFSLVKSNLLNDIFLIRDSAGLSFEKVHYYTVPVLFKKNIIFHICYKLIQGIIIVFVKEVDFIHSFLLFPHGFFALLTGKLLNKKVGVSLIAGPVELFITGSSPSGTHIYNQPLPSLSLKARIILALLKQFDVITCPGTFTKKTLISYGVKANKITVLPHIIPKRHEKEITLTPCEKKIDILYVGRLSKIKHVETILKAVDLLKIDFPNINCTIVGDGDEKLHLRKVIESKKLQKNVFLLGYKKNVWFYYRNAKMTVLMSEREGFPRVVLESMSCGTPVIVTKCGDIVDLINNGYNAYFMDDHLDYEELAVRIKSLLINERLLLRLSQNAYETIHNMDLYANTRKWSNILQQLE